MSTILQKIEVSYCTSKALFLPFEGQWQNKVTEQRATSSVNELDIFEGSYLKGTFLLQTPVLRPWNGILSFIYLIVYLFISLSFSLERQVISMMLFTDFSTSASTLLTFMCCLSVRNHQELDYFITRKAATIEHIKR